jgi:hypothetical protein
MDVGSSIFDGALLCIYFSEFVSTNNYRLPVCLGEMFLQYTDR